MLSYVRTLISGKCSSMIPRSVSVLTDHWIECGTIIISDPFRLTSRPAADSINASYTLPGPAA